MSSYLSDQEQLNLIREWLKKYGKLLSLSLTVFLLIFFGVHAWQNHKTTATENASILYERLLVNAQEHKNIDSFPEHQNTSYGELVALLQAKEALEKNDFDTAIHHFNWVISHTKNASLKQISETRLARVLVAKNQ